jgi:hypothetical protein
MSEPTFRAPNAKALADLKRLWDMVGLPLSPYGPAIMTIDDCFDLIEGMHGLDVAKRCSIEVVYH